MGLPLHRAAKALINVVIDSGITMSRRIEAAATLLEANVPDPVVNACRRFLLEVAENKEGIPGHRLMAAKAVLRRDCGKYRRVRIKPTKYVEAWRNSTRTVAERIEDGLRRTAERDAKLECERQLKLVSSTDTPTDKAS
jgi:hypothetical protein